jgi:hypothetical protein
LVVGTPGDKERGTAAGAAYVYRQTSTGWAGEDKLLPPKTNPPQAVTGSYFGSSVDISGNLLVIGAPQSDTLQDIYQAGAAFVFRRMSSTWSLESELNASNAAPSDHLGTAVAITAETVLAGAPGNDAGGSNTGAAYVFTKPWPTPFQEEDEGPEPSTKGVVSSSYDEDSGPPLWAGGD